MKSQAEIDRENKLRRALALAQRAMRPGSEAEGQACEALLSREMKKNRISDAELAEYARKQAKGGRKSEQGQQQEQRQGRGAKSDGFYYRDQRDSRRAAEEAEELRKKHERDRKNEDARQQRQEDWQRKQENLRRANSEWNEQFERKHGKPTSKGGWQFERVVSTEKTPAEKVVGFINSFFGV